MTPTLEEFQRAPEGTKFLDDDNDTFEKVGYNSWVWVKEGGVSRPGAGIFWSDREMLEMEGCFLSDAVTSSDTISKAELLEFVSNVRDVSSSPSVIYAMNVVLERFDLMPKPRKVRVILELEVDPKGAFDNARLLDCIDSAVLDQSDYISITDKLIEEM